MLIFTPSLALSILAARRAYPAAIPYLREGVSALAFWHAAAPDLPYPLRVNTSARLIDGPLRPGEFTLLLEDRGRRRGYAVKVLRVADVERNFETTTEDERMLLLDRMVKAVEGLGDVEAKLVIDRSPSGEKAYIILYSEVVEGDEEGAARSVESAAATLATNMESLRIFLIDDISYMGFKPLRGFTFSVRPSKTHAIALLAASTTTVVFSSLSVGLGAIGTVVAVSGVLGLLTGLRLLSAASKASCLFCGSRKLHTLVARRWGDQAPRRRGTAEEGERLIHRLEVRIHKRERQQGADGGGCGEASADVPSGIQQPNLHPQGLQDSSTHNTPACRRHSQDGDG
jgi:hypothetical protein